MGTIVSLTGQSGSGKSTFENHLITTASNRFSKVISHTTRTPRISEKNGKDYYFCSDDEYESIEFIESVQFNGAKYGVAKIEIERLFNMKKIPVIVAIPEGVKQMQNYCESKDWELFNVYVDCPPETLAERFMNRFNNELLGKQNKETTWNIFQKRLVTILGEERGWKNEMDFWCLTIQELTDKNREAYAAEMRDRLGIGRYVISSKEKVNV